MNLKALILATTLSLAVAGSAFAHCGMCGVGESKASSGDSHMMANKVCLCGMALTEANTEHATHEGKTYHFCSVDCANKFKENPAAAIEQIGQNEQAAE